MGRANKKKSNRQKTGKETSELNSNSINQSELTKPGKVSIHKDGDTKSERAYSSQINALDSLLDRVFDEMNDELNELMAMIQHDLQSPAGCQETVKTTSTAELTTKRANHTPSTKVEANMNESIERDSNYNLQSKHDRKEDADCSTSLLESVVTNFDQPTTSEKEKSQDRISADAYCDKNAEVCEKAHESCAQEDKETRKTLEDVPGPFADEQRDKIAENPPGLNLNQPISSQPGKSQRSKSKRQRRNLITVTSFENEYPKEKTATTRISSARVERVFKEQCFKKLKHGLCTRNVHCQYSHDLTPDLQHLGQSSAEMIKEVLGYAIYNGYNYFVRYIYPDVIGQLDYPSLMELFNKLGDSNLTGDEYLVELTIVAVTEAGIPLRKFLSDVANSLYANSDAVTDCVLKMIGNRIEQGTYWDTCRDLLIVAKPSDSSIARVIGECVQNEDKLQAQDVYLNFVARLTSEQSEGLSNNLRKQFDALLEQNDFFSETRRSNPRFFEHPPVWSSRRFSRQRNYSATKFRSNV